MQNIDNLVSQLEAAKVNLEEVAKRLKLHILDLEHHSKDYNFIKGDDVLKSKLLTHYRRMMSHELGLINENPILRFENICRNAHMQVEGMFSYFYKHHYKCVSSKFVSEYNNYVGEKNRIRHAFTTIEDKGWNKITFAQKNFLFQKFTNDIKLNEFIKVLNNYRNSISHIGYVDKRSDSAIESAEEVKDFADSKDVNAVLDALIKFREYVEYNTI